MSHATTSTLSATSNSTRTRSSSSVSTPTYIGRRIGPWLLDRAIERGFARGSSRLILNTNSVDHPRALDTYRKAGFRVVRSETRELQDPRVLWPDIYRWPPK